MANLCENSASTSGFEAYGLIFISTTHHCPLWSPCGLRCPPLRYLLTLCFLSQQAPSSLLEALEQHLASLEGKKVKDSTAASRYVNPSHHFSTISLISIRNLRGCIYFFFCNAGNKNKNVLPYRASTLSNAVSSLASTGMSFTKVDEREKQAALEEEQARLKALKVLLSPTCRDRRRRVRCGYRVCV